MLLMISTSSFVLSPPQPLLQCTHISPVPLSTYCKVPLGSCFLWILCVCVCCVCVWCVCVCVCVCVCGVSVFQASSLCSHESQGGHLSLPFLASVPTGCPLSPSLSASFLLYHLLARQAPACSPQALLGHSPSGEGTDLPASSSRPHLA